MLEAFKKDLEQKLSNKSYFNLCVQGTFDYLELIISNDQEALDKRKTSYKEAFDNGELQYAFKKVKDGGDIKIEEHEYTPQAVADFFLDAQNEAYKQMEETYGFERDIFYDAELESKIDTLKYKIRDEAIIDLDKKLLTSGEDGLILTSSLT